MAKKANGKTKIELEILNPEKFQTLQQIRDFITGDGAKALHYAIYRALSPAINISEQDELEVKLKDELKAARLAALFVNEDLGALARGAIESTGDPEVFNNQGQVLNEERRELVFIALRDGDAVDETRRGIIEHLSAANEDFYYADTRLRSRHGGLQNEAPQ